MIICSYRPPLELTFSIASKLPWLKYRNRSETKLKKGKSSIMRSNEEFRVNGQGSLATNQSSITNHKMIDPSVVQAKSLLKCSIPSPMFHPTKSKELFPDFSTSKSLYFTRKRQKVPESELEGIDGVKPP